MDIDENGDFQFDQDALLTLQCGCQWQQHDSLGMSTYNFFPIDFPMFSAPMAGTKVLIITPHDVDVNGNWKSDIRSKWQQWKKPSQKCCQVYRLLRPLGTIAQESKSLVSAILNCWQ